MKTEIGLSEKATKEVGEALSELLSNELSLYVRTLLYHWNVIGPSFIYIHELLNSQYEKLQGIADSVAERMRTIGIFVDGTPMEILQKGIGFEDPQKISAMQMISDLVDRHETIIKKIRARIPAVQDADEDAGTANFLTDIMEKHEKMAWKLRAHTETRSEN